MKKINSIKLLNPFTITTIIFGFQLIFWLLFFPLEPTIENGEPKELSLIALIIFLTALTVNLIGCKIGEAATRWNHINYNPNEDLKYYRIGVLFLYIAALATLLKLEPVINNPNLLLLFLEPSGSNKIHKILSESSFGIASLQTLWIIPAIIFSFLIFSKIWKKTFFFYTNILILISIVLSLAAINSARIALINLILIFTSTYIYIKKPNLSIIKVLFSFAAFFFIYWLGSISRDGLVYAESRNINIFSLDVLFYIFTVFMEKYTLGEFNNALIIMSYEAQSGNFAYGTAFQRYFPASSPDRLLNTFNIFGHWYWQFGYTGLILISLVFGLIFGKVYKASINPNKTNEHQINYLVVIYFMIYIGIFNATRVNYYFLQLFFIPLIFFMFTICLLKLFRKI